MWERKSHMQTHWLLLKTWPRKSTIFCHRQMLLLFFIIGDVGIFTHFRKDRGNHEGFFQTNLKSSFTFRVQNKVSVRVGPLMRFFFSPSLNSVEWYAMHFPSQATFKRPGMAVVTELPASPPQRCLPCKTCDKGRKWQRSDSLLHCVCLGGPRNCISPTTFAINTQLSGLIMWNSGKFTWGLRTNDILVWAALVKWPSTWSRNSKIAQENLVFCFHFTA